MERNLHVYTRRGVSALHLRRKFQQLMLILIIFTAEQALAQSPGNTPTLIQYSFNLPFAIDGHVERQSTAAGAPGDWTTTTALFPTGAIFHPTTGQGSTYPVTLTRHIVDAYTGADDIFGTGAKASDNPNTLWTWTTGSADGKTNVHNAMIHVGRDAADNTWIMLAADRESQNGTSYIDFEFLQAPLVKNTNGTFTSGASNATGGRTPNDILVSMEYVNGGSTPNLLYFKWQLNGLNYDWVPFSPGPGTAYAATNAFVTNVPFGAFGSTSYPIYSFVEAAINVTAFITIGDPCSSAGFSSLFIKTKASNSSTAVLKDLVGPIQLNFSGGFTAAASATPIVCNGGNSTITVTASGGVPPYQYAINGGAWQSTNTFTVGAGGPYVIAVRDANLCVKVADSNMIITQPAPLTAAVTGNNVACFGGTGTATATPSGGTSPYTYSWNTNPAQTTQSISGLSPGNYLVTVTDANGCVTTAPRAVTQPSGPLNAVIGGQTNVSCYGTSSGSATVLVTGGTTPYTYSWNTTPAQTSATASGLPAGTYSVAVTDGNGCTQNVSVTITQPSVPFTVTLAAQQNVLCSGQTTGSATAVAAGGTPPYTYSWNSTPAQTTATAFNLGAGNYTVTVTDALGCIQTGAATITQPWPPLAATVTSQTNILCAGGFGAATVTATGGTSPYTYFWNTSPVQTTPSVTGLTPGTYTVGVTDANGCPQSASLTITAPPVLSATLNSVSHLTCHNANNGAASVSVTGGVAPYTYSWNTTPVQTTASVSNLPAGSYTATVTDANGCMDTVHVTVNQPGALTPVISVANLFCVGGTNGSATVTMYGGTAPYSYSWNSSPVQTTPTATNLPVGTYTVTVTDANGCITTANATLGIPSAPLNASISGSTPVMCYGQPVGSASVTASGGTAPYTYTWSTSPVQQTATATALMAGSYNVIVTDNNGCNDTAFVTIAQPTTPVNVNLTASFVSCFNGSNGSATAFTSGGQPPYTYAWNTTPVQTAATATGLSAGSYTVTVTDANGCSYPNLVTIQQPAAPVTVALASQSNVLCKNAATGSATVTASGGTGAYTYLWNTTPAQNTATATNLAAGNYSVTVSDIYGCSQSIGVSITQPASAVNAVIAGQTNIACHGNATGSAIAAASGGLPPYTYSWSTTPVQTTAAISNLLSGNYNVIVTDANGCMDTATASIAQPVFPLSVQMSPTSNVSCYGTATGWATATVTGGSGSYTYSWNTTPAQTTATATGLAAGTYSVTVTDMMGCTQTGSVTITQPSTPVGIAVSGQTPVLCNGAATGTATVTGNGGTAPYTYVWNTAPVQVGATATGLAAGSYTVSVTDANGCYAPTTATITQLPAVNANISATTMISCNGGTDGTATATPTGGTPPYTYVWSTNPAQTTPTATGLLPAWYAVTVTDANGCTNSAMTPIYQPTPIVPAVTVSNLNCLGATNATASVSASGGTPPYTYVWNTTPAQTGASANNLGAGTYVVTVTDAHNCVAYGVATIAVPTSPLAASVTGVIPVDCFGGTTGAATAVANGGTAPYTYSWNTNPVQMTPTASGLSAGTYVVTTMDLNGCTDLDTVTINQPAAPLGSTISAANNVPCFGLTTGSATVTPTGGTAPYSYSWSTSPVQATATAGNLPAGTYSVTITDANGCVTPDSVVISQPTALNVAANTLTQVPCFDGNSGSASVNVTGGTLPYSYSWNSLPVQTGTTATNLAAGLYTVTVTDGNGCVGTAQATINQPAQMVPTVTISNLFCAGGTNGSATVNMTGGVTPYTYSWNTTPAQTTATASNLVAGTYAVTVTDANGCTVSSTATVAPPAVPLSATVSGTIPAACYNTNTGSATAVGAGGTAPYTYSWSTVPAQTTATAGNLGAGTYNVIVTDNNGCMDTAMVTITQPASSVGLTVSGTDVSCFNGTNGAAVAAGTGGTPPYTYTWNSVPAQSTATATGLPAGVYTATITDANGCTSNQQVTLTQPTPVTTAIGNVNNIQCFGLATGSATATVGGGTAPYTYSWNTNPVQTTPTASNLTAGTYVLTVTDSVGCVSTVNVPVSEPPLLTVNAVNSNIVCYGDTNGSVTANVTGGTAPYTYNWNILQTTQSINNLPPGFYSVTVTDGNGCTATSGAQVTMPQTPLLATATATNVNCFGGADGTALVNTTGGTAPYTYLWNTTPAQTGSTATGLQAGSYSVTVTDVNGCLDTVSVALSQPAELLASAQELKGTCPGEATGRASVTVSGGAGPYTTSWNTIPVQTTSQVQNLYAGTYTVTVTDANGCIKAVPVTIQAFPAPVVDAGPDSVICEGQSIDLLASGANTYTWGPFGSLSCYACPNPVATPPTTTTYRVIGINAFNCRDTDVVTIGVLHRNPVAVGPDVRICTGESANLTATGGGTYLWIPSTGLSDSTSSSPSVHSDTSINYRVIITQNRCFTDTLDQAFMVYARPTITLGPDHTGIIGTQYRIPVDVTNASSITWTPTKDLNCSSCFDPIAILNGEVTYTATVSNEIGCTASDDITLKAICDNSAIFMPNTFTPNGDGTNDHFMPMGTGLLVLDRFSVYNRWGELMYQVNNARLSDNIYGWDGNYKGEPLTPDVYVYIIEATCPTKEHIFLKGDVSLIR